MTLTLVFRKIADHPSLVIFLLALALRVGWVSSLDNSFTWPDEEEFAAIGRHLAQGRGYISNSYGANPGVPVYLALIFSIFGERYFWARLGQSIVGASTCVLVSRVASLTIGQSAGLLSGLLLATYLPHIYISGVFYAVCLATFFLALSIYLATITVLITQRYIPCAFLTGVALGLCALTRPVLTACTAFVPLAWLYSKRKPRCSLLTLCAGLLIGATSTVAPWTVRNYLKYGRVIPISSGFYQTLWKGNNVLAVGNSDDRFLLPGNDLWLARLRRLAPHRREQVVKQYAQVTERVRAYSKRYGDTSLAWDEVLKPIALEYMRANPTRVARVVPRKLVTLFSAFSKTEETNRYTNSSAKLLGAANYWPVLVLSMVGMVLGLRRRRELALLYFVVGGMVSTHLLLTTCTRFRLPLDPYFITFATLPIFEGWQLAKKRRSRLCGACQ